MAHEPGNNKVPYAHDTASPQQDGMARPPDPPLVTPEPLLDMPPLLRTVHRYWSAGLTPLPRLAGTPGPAFLSTTGEVHPILWSTYKTQQPDWSTVAEWFAVGDASVLGVVVVTGTPAYPKDREEPLLQILDLESAAIYEAWHEAVTFAGCADVLHRCVIERTPSGGAHVGFWCTAISEKQKLPLAKRHPQALLIELLQHQTCTIAPTSIPCKPAHPPETAYRVIHGAWETPQAITQVQRQALIDIARSFNEVPARLVRDYSEITPATGTRPGDRLNTEADAAWWTDVLTAQGWRDVTPRGRRAMGMRYFQRPGKYGTQPSATYGHTGACLYVFSSNAHPFEPETAYTPFRAYAYLVHGGNFTAATLALAEQYGMVWPPATGRPYYQTGTPAPSIFAGPTTQEVQPWLR